MVAHDVSPAAPRIVRAGAGASRASRLAQKSVHLAAVDIRNCVRMSVRTALIAVVAVMIRFRASDRRIGNAHSGRNPIRTRIRAEIGIERAILLHDDDDVADLMDARRVLRRRPQRRADSGEYRHNGDQREGEKSFLHPAAIRAACPPRPQQASLAWLESEQAFATFAPFGRVKKQESTGIQGARAGVTAGFPPARFRVPLEGRR